MLIRQTLFRQMRGSRLALKLGHSIIAIHLFRYL